MHNNVTNFKSLIDHIIVSNTNSQILIAFGYGRKWSNRI